MPSQDNLASAAVALRQGKYAEAIALCGAQLKSTAGNAQALHLRGLAHHMAGNAESAVADLRQAVRQLPTDPAVLANLGRVLAAQENYGESLQYFERAIAAAPNAVAELEDYGTALCRLNRIEEGAAAFERALSLDKQRASAMLKLARVRVLQSRHADAIALARKATAADRNSLLRGKAIEGLAALSEGRAQDAVALFTDVLSSDPANTEALAGRARAYYRLGRLDLARADAGAGLAVRPTDSDLAYLAGSIDVDAGDFQRARETYSRLLVRKPDSFRARWAHAMALPLVFDSAEQIEAIRSEWRSAVEALAADLRLDSEDGIGDAVDALNLANNFGLNYDGCDDRELQELYGGVVHRVARARYPRFGEPWMADATARSRPRVGFVTRFLRNTSLWKTHGAWVTDTQGPFEKCVFYTGTDAAPELLAQARKTADILIHEPDAQRLISEIAAQQLDLLIYLDHGVRVDLQIPAGLWLARIQANGLAHPITSGLPTLAYGISSALMEPPNGQAHYSERLVVLPNTASSFKYGRMGEILGRIGKVDRAADRTRFLCSQNLRKYLPQHDEAFVRIALEIPGAEFHFIEGPRPATQLFRQRLHRAFAERGLAAEHHCRLHPTMSIEDYFRLNLQCDIFLDSMIWSGNNTAHEAVACGLPIVTLPGAMMRGRHCLAILQRLGLTDTIASSMDDYVSIAVRLARDGAWREHLQAETVRRQSRVFDDPEPIQALQSVMLALCSGQTAEAFSVQPQQVGGAG